MINEQITLITEKQLSNILQIPARSLQNQRQYGVGIPYIKIGKLVRYDLNEVQKHINSQKRISTKNE